MSRPRRRPRVTDRVVQALRDQLLLAGHLDVLIKADGTYTPVRWHGRVYGPGYDPPAGAIRLRLQVGRGRPRAGHIGLVQALGLVTGYTERVVCRALSGAPRGGTRKAPDSPCPVCGRASTDVLPPPLRDIAENTTRRDLAAVGLATVDRPAHPPAGVGDAVREVLIEALDAALAMGVLTAPESTLAAGLRGAIGHPR